MNGLPDLLDKLWPILLSMVAFVIWLIRLEAEVKYLKKGMEALAEEALHHRDSLELRYGELDKAIWEKFEALQASMNSIMQTLGRLEGKLEKK